MNTNTTTLKSEALDSLRAAGYSANSHPQREDSVVVNEQVYASRDGVTVVEYKHTTLTASAVHRFLLSR